MFLQKVDFRRKMIKDPKVIDNVLNLERINNFANTLKSSYKTFSYDSGFGRYCVGDGYSKEFRDIFEDTVDIARKAFNSSTLLPTYALFAHYEGNASLYKHKDDNACTYTLDMCIYQSDPWDLYVEDKPYTLYPNQALAYYGNEQMHWREAFPNPENQHVAMVFFHYAEPDHWYFTKGPGYIEVIRGNLTDDQWDSRQVK
jgi:hypothetical protein